MLGDGEGGANRDTRAIRVISGAVVHEPKHVETSARTAAEIERETSLAHVLKDLQTPVAVLGLSLEFLAGELGSEAPGTRAALRDALRAGRRIQRYIDHFVVGEISGVAGLRGQRRHVDLGALLRTLVDEYEMDGAGAGKMVLDVGTPAPSVRGDETLLDRAFQNVIEASLAHSHGRRIHIQARGGRVAEVAVCIDGPMHPRAERAAVGMGTASARSENADLELVSALDACAVAFRRVAGVVSLAESTALRTCFEIRLPNATI